MESGSVMVAQPWKPSIAALNEALADAGVPVVISQTLRAVGPDLRGTFYARATEGNQSRKVVHLLPVSKIIDMEGSGSSSKFLVEQKFFKIKLSGAPEDMAIAVRDKQSLLQHSLSGQGRNRTRLSTRVKVLQDVLNGMTALHHEGRLAGDLRLDNVAITSTGAALVDYNMIPESTYPREINNLSERDDLVAFQKLALRLLGPRYMWDGRNFIPQIGQLYTSGFEWILEYCCSVADTEIPTARQLSEVVFAQSESVSRIAAENLTLAVASVRDASENREDGADVAYTARIVSMLIRLKFDTFPETQIAFLSPDRASSIYSWIALDLLRNKWETEVDEIESKNQNQYRDITANYTVDKRDLGNHIDDAWRDRVHQWHFGTSIDLDHDHRVAQLAETSELEGQQAYGEHLAVMDELRCSLLAEHDFLYTDAVEKLLLAAEGEELTTAEVLVLRQWGSILAVPDHGRWLYPLFQFNPQSGRPLPLIGDVASELTFEDPWDALAWWSTGRSFLDGQSLASVIHQEDADKHVWRAIAGHRA